jgi:asparagine synthase (glutamine-hydrolysing)
MTGLGSEAFISRSFLTDARVLDAPMKLQLGLLHTDGKRATQNDLADLLGEFASKPAATSGQTSDSELLMAYRGDRITYEEDCEVQPLQRGPYILTFDGRLDNREELATRLGLTNLRSIPDPAIVLQAYETFGQSVFDDLIGEFAAALWCRRTKSLLLARSACGARPLYYVLNKECLIWSSDFAHLVRISAVDLEVNESYVLEYLLTQPSSKHTALTKVCSVPANSLVRFANGGLSQVRDLWNPTRIATLNYRSDREYEEHFRTALTDAVRARLRAKPPIFAELSGGLDSSSIVLTADQVLKSSDQPPDNLKTLSFVYEESQTCDERQFIRVVENLRGIQTIQVGEKAQRFTLGLENPEFTGLPNALHCTPGRYETFAALMKTTNGRILLTGLGGDHLFWSAPEGAPLVADQLRRGNVPGAHRECRTWSRAAGVPYFQLMLNKAVPLAMRRPYGVVEIPCWLSENMREHAASKIPELLGAQPRNARPGRRAQIFSVDLLFRTVGAGYFNEYKDFYISHPYTYRPLVEFCLAVSLSQFLRSGQTRSLMRRALVGLLPSKICKRVSKAGADEAYIRVLQQQWAKNSDVARWKVCERGYVDREQLSTSLNCMQLGIQQQSGYLMRLISMERWLRSLGQVQACNTREPKEIRREGIYQLLRAT